MYLRTTIDRNMYEVSNLLSGSPSRDNGYSEPPLVYGILDFTGAQSVVEKFTDCM